jgi:hypothetical protein
MRQVSAPVTCYQQYNCLGLDRDMIIWHLASSLLLLNAGDDLCGVKGLRGRSLAAFACKKASFLRVLLESTIQLSRFGPRHDHLAPRLQSPLTEREQPQFVSTETIVLLIAGHRG